jgi:hypothetical protein
MTIDKMSGCDECVLHTTKQREGRREGKEEFLHFYLYSPFCSVLPSCFLGESEGVRGPQIP